MKYAKLLTLCLLLISCSHHPASRQLVYDHFAAQKHAFSSGKDLMVILFHHGDCVGCNLTIYSLVTNGQIMNKTGADNICFVTRAMRPAEADEFAAGFSYFKTKPVFIADDALFHKIQNELDSEKKMAGIIIYDNAGNITCRTTFKDPAFNQKIAQYMNAR